MTLQAVLFDLDGTLVDSERLWAEAMRDLLVDRQCPCDTETVLRIVYGHSWIDIYQALVTRFPVLSEIPRHRLAEHLRVYYERLRGQGEGVVIRSSVTLMKQLARDYPVILVSGSPRHDLEEAVRLMEIERDVRFVLGAEDYEPGKPSPAGFLLGARRLGVPPEHCLVFEDSRVGVLAAKRAGMLCVALARPGSHPQELSEADWILEDLAAFTVDGLRNRLARPK
jgi:beta-phosphoglucomutase-like phosphatase (HAD superfamily)